jgi:hypothetical protein
MGLRSFGYNILIRTSLTRAAQRLPTLAFNDVVVELARPAFVSHFLWGFGVGVGVGVGVGPAQATLPATAYVVPGWPFVPVPFDKRMIFQAGSSALGLEFHCIPPELPRRRP